jgi:hypothetical protein
MGNIVPMKNDDVWSMLEEQGLLTERKKHAHPQRLVKEGDTQEHQGTSEIRPSPEAGGCDRTGFSKKVQTQEAQDEKKA